MLLIYGRTPLSQSRTLLGTDRLTGDIQHLTGMSAHKNFHGGGGGGGKPKKRPPKGINKVHLPNKEKYSKKAPKSWPHEEKALQRVKNVANRPHIEKNSLFCPPSLPTAGAHAHT